MKQNNSVQTFISDLCRFLNVPNSQEIIKSQHFDMNGVTVGFVGHDWGDEKQAISFYMDICKESDLTLQQFMQLMAENHHVDHSWGCFAIDVHSKRVLYKLTLDWETRTEAALDALHRALDQVLQKRVAV